MLYLEDIRPSFTKRKLGTFCSFQVTYVFREELYEMKVFYLTDVVPNYSSKLRIKIVIDNITLH